MGGDDPVVPAHRLQDVGKLIGGGIALRPVHDAQGHAGGSGCGCSGVVLCGYLARRMAQRQLSRLLFCGTGALLSPTSTQQGESIPAVCHAVSIYSEEAL